MARSRRVTFATAAGLTDDVLPKRPLAYVRSQSQTLMGLIFSREPYGVSDLNMRSKEFR